MEIKLHGPFISLDKFVECKWGQVTDSNLYEKERTCHIMLQRATDVNQRCHYCFQQDLGFRTELHYRNNLSLDDQIRQAKLDCECKPVNLPRAWPLIKPLDTHNNGCYVRIHKKIYADCVTAWTSEFGEGIWLEIYLLLKNKRIACLNVNKFNKQKWIQLE